MDKKRILVCGGTGFIGRNMVSYFLNQGHYVSATYFVGEPWCDDVNWVSMDLRNPLDMHQLLSQHDILVQAAATTSGVADIASQPHIHVTDNAVMNSYLFRAAFDVGIQHVIFFSCTIMYPSLDRPVLESDFSHGADIHNQYFGAAWTKIYLEKMAEFYSQRSKATKWTVLRHSNIYGPWDKYGSEKSHVFAATLDKVMQEKEDAIEIWGDGEEVRDLLYVDDLVHAVDASISNQKSEFGLYNIGSGVSISINDLAKKIILHSGKSLNVTHNIKKPSIKTKIILDCKKANNELDWISETSIDKGIKNSIKWYSRHML